MPWDSWIALQRVFWCMATQFYTVYWVTNFDNCLSLILHAWHASEQPSHLATSTRWASNQTGCKFWFSVLSLSCPFWLRSQCFPTRLEENFSVATFCHTDGMQRTPNRMTTWGKCLEDPCGNIEKKKKWERCVLTWSWKPSRPLTICSMRVEMVSYLQCIPRRYCVPDTHVWGLGGSLWALRNVVASLHVDQNPKPWWY